MEAKKVAYKSSRFLLAGSKLKLELDLPVGFLLVQTVGWLDVSINPIKTISPEMVFLIACQT